VLTFRRGSASTAATSYRGEPGTAWVRSSQRSSCFAARRTGMDVTATGSYACVVSLSWCLHHSLNAAYFFPPLATGRYRDVYPPGLR
jgi:hypothetical protein